MKFIGLLIKIAAVRIFLFIFIFFDGSLKATGHPQCLDHKPPFQPLRALSFCSEYSSYGCCTTEDDDGLAQKFSTLHDRFYYTMSECGPRLRTILCLQCDPYAAHLFDAEGRRRAAAFPGLCNDTCPQFLRDCRHLPSWAIAYTFAQEDRALATILHTNPSKFCARIALNDVDYCFPALKTNAALANGVVESASDEDGCFCLKTFAEELKNPLLATHAGDGSHRLFVVEQKGIVWVYLQDGTRLRRPFLNLTEHVYTSRFAGDERGLLGLAFHPRFVVNNKLYVYYSVRTEGKHLTRISEFKVSQRDMNKVRGKSERVVLEIEEPYFNHNGGMLHFGVDDGFLYAYVGDGGGAGDWDNNAQNLSTLLGKVLRMDVDRPSGRRRYSIPTSNPFLSVPGARPEIWAFGIRNIWRCGVDHGDPRTRAGRGRIICGDVGQDKYEEIDLMIAGGNYGWRGREGFQCFDESQCGADVDEVLPIHAYGRREGKSVTGGVVYRGCEMPKFNGHFVFGDFLSGRIWRLKEKRVDGKIRWENRELKTCGRKKCLVVNGLEWRRNKFILSFGEDESGEIYLLSTSDFSNEEPMGKVYKFVDPNKRGNPKICSERRLSSRRVAVRQKNRERKRRYRRYDHLLL